MKTLNLNCFESKNGNFIAMKSMTTFEDGKEPVKDYHYYWFSADGTFLRPAVYQEWEYANSWGNAQKKAFTCPIQKWTHENAVVECNGRQWVNCASDSMGYRLFQAEQSQLTILEKLVAGGEFAFGGSFFRCGNTFLRELSQNEIEAVKDVIDWVVGIDDDGGMSSIQDHEPIVDGEGLRDF